MTKTGENKRNAKNMAEEAHPCSLLIQSSTGVNQQVSIRMRFKSRICKKKSNINQFENSTRSFDYKLQKEKKAYQPPLPNI